MDKDSKFPSQVADRFQVRMPDGLRDRLRELAEANNRSMNAQIVHMLEQGVAEEEAMRTDIETAPDEDIDFFNEEAVISAAVGEKAGSPATVVLVARMLSRVDKMSREIDEKLERLIALQTQLGLRAPDDK